MPLHSEDIIKITLSMVRPGTIVISGDQNKLNLQNMLITTKQLGGEWAMPIRKFAPLPYPFEQLHGCLRSSSRMHSTIFCKEVFMEIDGCHRKSIVKTTMTSQSPKLKAKRRPNSTRKTLNSMEGRRTFTGHFKF
jgi:hypothetical protein